MFLVYTYFQIKFTQVITRGTTKYTNKYLLKHLISNICNKNHLENTHAIILMILITIEGTLDQITLVLFRGSNPWTLQLYFDWLVPN